MDLSQNTQLAITAGFATLDHAGTTDRLNFTGGLRLSHDTKDIEYLRRGTVDYHLTDDIMAYATASKAFKGGQFSYTVVANLSGPDQSSIIRPIAPEKVINYEAGLRTTWLNGRLRFNPTGYYMSWTNRQSAQQQACPGDPSCPTGFRIVVVNSGNVDVWGVEVDAQFALTNRLTLEGAVGTTKYRLDQDLNRGPYLNPDQAMPQYNLGLNYRGGAVCEQPARQGLRHLCNALWWRLLGQRSGHGARSSPTLGIAVGNGASPRGGHLAATQFLKKTLRGGSPPRADPDS